MENQPTSRLSMLGQLDGARQLLESSQVEQARGLATQVLQLAEELGDLCVQGQALMALAQYDRVLGRFRRAVATAQRAVHLFQLDGDIAQEATALALVAHAYSFLGRNEEAVEAGLLSVKLGDLLPPSSLQVNLYNYLGVSFFWSKALDQAKAALQEAERLALAQAAPVAVLLPRINLAWLEAMRLVQERYFNGGLQDTGEFARRLDLCGALFESNAPFPGLPGVRAVLQRFGRCLQSLLHCWRGDFEAAQLALDLARDQSNPGNYAQVANSAMHWVQAEIHWAAKDFPAAQRQARLLVERAGEAEFEQMAYLGHQLLTQIYTDQGDCEGALAEQRALQRRQLRVRVESLEGRQRVVQAQLDVRLGERDLNLLATQAQELERLSLQVYLPEVPSLHGFDASGASAIRLPREATSPATPRVAHPFRALGVMYHLRDSQMQLTASLAALDRLSGGVVLLTQSRHVKFANSAAQALLKNGAAIGLGPSVTGKSGQLVLHPRLASYERRFQHTLANAMHNTAAEVRERFSRALLLPDSDGKPSCVVLAAPLGETASFDAIGADVKAIVFLYDLGAAASVSAPLLCELFEMTMAEAQAALQLSRGGSAEQMAQQLGTTLSTFKTHLQSVYRKTGVHRQADLLKLLLALASR